MKAEAIIHGQAAAAGTPANGKQIMPTTAPPTAISAVVDNGSRPTLISAFQLAWQSAPNKTAMKTKFAMLPASGGRRGRRPELRADAQILWRPLDLGAERLCGMPAPMRIVEEGARQRHAVGFALRNDGLGLLGLDDHADDAG